MIREETVFILGAGASKPYGYPTGAELRKNIINEFRNHYHYNNIVHLQLDTFKEDATNSLNTFINSFDLSSTKSIDLFLSRNPKFMDIGKLAIKLSIYNSELKSKFRENIDRNEDWYSYLFDRLTNEFIDPDQYIITHNKIKFITFNYDRSLEHYFHDSMTNSYGEIEKSIIECEVNRIKIIHMFGTISSLPWQENGGLLYGKDGVIFDSADNLDIIYNKTNDPMIIEAQKLIRKAKLIFFLGFGYTKENLEILNFPDIIQPGQKVFGTTKGLEPREINDIREKYFSTDKVPEKNITLENCNSLELIRKYL